jgi:hypothetical protein
MNFFITKNKRKKTKTVLSVGLFFLPEETDIDIITIYQTSEYVEYYLFNLIKIYRKDFK